MFTQNISNFPQFRRTIQHLVRSSNIPVNSTNMRARDTFFVTNPPSVVRNNNTPVQNQSSQSHNNNQDGNFNENEM